MPCSSSVCSEIDITCWDTDPVVDDDDDWSAARHGGTKKKQEVRFTKKRNVFLKKKFTNKQKKCNNNISSSCIKTTSVLSFRWNKTVATEVWVIVKKVWRLSFVFFCVFVILFICFFSSLFFFCYADVIGSRGLCVNDLSHVNVAHRCILETMKPSVWRAANTPSL